MYSVQHSMHGTAEATAFMRRHFLQTAGKPRRPKAIIRRWSRRYSLPCCFLCREFPSSYRMGECRMTKLPPASTENRRERVHDLPG
jgi:hypothetical protein